MSRVKVKATPTRKRRTKAQRARAFYLFCKRWYACEAGLKWVKGKTYKEVWDTLDNPCWLMWLADTTLSVSGIAPPYPEPCPFEKMYPIAEAANGGHYVALGGMENAKGEYVVNHEAFGYPKVCAAIRDYVGKRPTIKGL